MAEKYSYIFHSKALQKYTHFWMSGMQKPSANPATQCDQIRPIFANLAIFNLGFFLILRTSNFWALRFHRKSLVLNMDWAMYIPMYLGT
jgi:hypothetical protein